MAGAAGTTGITRLAGQPLREFIPDSFGEAWRCTAEAWRALPPTPGVMQPVDQGDGRIWLPYAELVAPEPRKEAGEIASWIAQVAEVYASLELDVPRATLGALERPVFGVDAGRMVRITFLAPSVPSRPLLEVLGDAFERDWGRYREFGIDELIARCGRRARDRFKTIGALGIAAERLELWKRRRSPRQWEAFAEYERGCGFEKLGRPDDALACYRQAIKLDPDLRLARDARRAARRVLIAPTPEPPVRPRFADVQPWADAEPELLQLEAEQHFPVARYAARREPEAKLGLARCQLALGHYREALLAARAAPQRFEALFVEMTALAKLGDHAGALATTGELLALADDDADVYYARGRALFALRRLPEARASLEHAAALRPGFVEAMLVRREVDRAALAVRRAAGVSASPAPAPTGPLGEARALVATGFVDAAIDLLRALADDGEARLLLASCLLFAARPTEALAIYEVTPGHVARVGAARSLLALDRLADALAAFDRALAERPSDLDALDGRAAALDGLGRTDDAERAHRRAVAVALGRGLARDRSRHA